jgi:hypothetical protein
MKRQIIFENNHFLVVNFTGYNTILIYYKECSEMDPNEMKDRIINKGYLEVHASLIKELPDLNEQTILSTATRAYQLLNQYWDIECDYKTLFEVELNDYKNEEDENN